MYQNSILGQTRIAISLVAAALLLGAGTAGAQDVTKCQRSIVKNAQKYASARAKALQKCEDGLLNGKVMSCPDQKADDKIDKAATKLGEKIVKDCTGVSLADMGFAGKVNRCNGGDLDGNRCVDVNDCPNGGTCDAVDECPTYLNGRLPGDDACEIALSTPQSVSDCIECATNAKVDALIATLYGTLNAPSADKDTFKCQREIGKRAAKYFDAADKALSKCEDALLNGKVMSCPDQKADDKIAKALTKLGAAMDKKCGSGALIGGATSASRIWGEAPRFGSCGVTGAQTAAGLSATLACLADGAATCDAALSTGDNACSIPLCGNGQIDDGETCDDGNTTRDTGVGGDDICPSDCSVAACAVTGSQGVTVNLTVPEDIVNALVLVSYDDNKVSIPGIGNQAPVVAAVTSGTFATSPRDTDTALRINLEDPFLIGVGSGPAATITFDVCSAAVLAAADFGCMVVDAGNTSFANITGATCSISVP
jgi:hypothetical protein